jgi:hypothetical protein
MRTVVGVAGPFGFLAPLAGGPSRRLGCLLMIAGALLAALAWASGHHLELRP